MANQAPACSVTSARGVILASGLRVDQAAADTLGVTVSDKWAANRIKRDGEHFHITLLSKDDAKLARADPAPAPSAPRDVKPEAGAGKAEILQHPALQAVDPTEWIDVG